MLPPNFALPMDAGGGGQTFLFNMDENLAEAASMHEGLQVYTVGHLMPRQSVVNSPQSYGSPGDLDQTQSSSQQQSLSGVWPIDGSQPQQQEGDGAGGGSEEDDEDEVVRPSINTTDENGVLHAMQLRPPPPPRKASSSTAASTPGASSSSQNVGGSSNSSLVVATAGGSGSKKLRVRRSTFVPGWAVPPRVLLVDDDAISRKLSSKFLQVFGCTTDVAVDGMSAVTKMNLEKYDLVLMDIVMPKLDGVSATSMIRKFDTGTPIISMTSNSKPNEIMTYYSSGMNDILPKPFSKQGLFDMLEKHLNHLKTIQQMSRNIARGPGIPPLSDANFEQALAQSAQQQQQLALPGPSNSISLRASSSSAQNNDNNSSSNSEGPLNAPSPFNFNTFFGIGLDQGGSDMNEGRINPLAGMGLTDEQYGVMLANMMTGENVLGGLTGSPTASTSSPTSTGASGFMMGGVGISVGLKRGYDETGDLDLDLEGPQGKKSRFEVIE
ncbi:hypothetical protein H1R20_g16492, partial [Candolleomyces eurysporus]